MIMNVIDEMIRDITNEKNKLDEVVFLIFLKEELDRQGIELTVIHSPKTLISENLITSDITGVQLDLSEHDKKKNAEIEKCRAEFGIFRSEMNKKIREYQKQIDEIKEKLERQIKSSMIAEEYVEELKENIERERNIINQIDYVMQKIFGITHDSVKTPDEFEKILQEKVEYFKSCEDFLPNEPIKMTDLIVNRFKQGVYPVYETDKNGQRVYSEIDGEKTPIETGEYRIFNEVNEIADYLLAYCKYHGGD